MFDLPWSRPVKRLATPLLDPGSPAQASLPIVLLPLARSPADLLDCAARRFAGLSSVPACSGTEAPAQNRPMLCGPSWVDHSCVPLCPPNLKPPEGDLNIHRTASRLRKINSSGASYQLTPKRTRRNSLLPAGGDRPFGHLPHLLAVASFPMRPGPPSRSQVHNARPGRVAKAKNGCSSLWITGISGTTRGTFFDSPKWPRFGCRFVPLRLTRSGARTARRDSRSALSRRPQPAPA